MESLHTSADLYHDDQLWAHMLPEDWAVMWTSAERKAAVDTIIDSIGLLCEVWPTVCK